jgi:hypothetical protein
MRTTQLVFAQHMDLLPRHEFAKWVARKDGNRRVRRWDQFLVMNLEPMKPQSPVTVRRSQKKADRYQGVCGESKKSPAQKSRA